MNLKVGRVSPLRAVWALPNCGAHGVTRPTGSWSRCRRKKRKGALHEPWATNPPLTPPSRRRAEAALWRAAKAERGPGHAVRLPSLEGLGVGSCSQCTTRPRGLSMNRRFGVPALAGPGRLKAGHQTSFASKSGSWSQCMRKKSESGLSMNRSAELQFGTALSFRRAGIAPNGSSALQCSRFMVPLHARKRNGAFHEPEGRARQSPARRLCIAKLRRAPSDAPYRFKVPRTRSRPTGSRQRTRFRC